MLNYKLYNNIIFNFKINLYIYNNYLKFKIFKFIIKESFVYIDNLIILIIRDKYIKKKKVKSYI